MNIDTMTLTISVVVILIALVLAEMPIWVALAGSGSIGLLVLSGSSITYNTLGSIPYSATAKYSLVIIPMFVFMGVLASKAGLAGDIFAVAERLVRRIPGGLGVATILACGGFSAVTGSSSATVATIGRIAVEQMQRHGYRANGAAAIVALGGTLGVLIPPSIILVVYGTLTGESVGQLLIAGIIPGIITIAFYSFGIMIAYRQGFFNPRTEKELRVAARFEQALQNEIARQNGDVSIEVQRKTTLLTEKPQKSSGAGYTRLELSNFTGTGYILLLFFIIIGGMYSGIFTATEAGAVAAVAALVILLIRRMRHGSKDLFTRIKESLLESADISTMIFALIFGGAIFAFFLVKTGLPTQLARNISEWGLHPMVVVVIAILFMMALGMFVDGITILVVVIPLLYPILDQLGVNGIWFAILTVKAVEIGMITPPVGINVFVASGINKDVSADGIFRAVIPFYLTEVAVILVLILFPDVVTFLPDLMFQK